MHAARSIAPGGLPRTLSGSHGCDATPVCRRVRAVCYHEAVRCLVRAAPVMEAVQILVASRASLPELSAVMAEAFSTEGIHSHLFDLSRRHARTGLCRALRVELESAVSGGDRILAAHMGGRIVGGAMVTGSRRRPAGERMVQGLRWLCAAAPLLPAVRWRNLPAFHRASSLSRPIVGAYYTLPALTVHPAFQGRGIGTMLLRAVHELAEHDSSALGVYLYTGERKNQLLYEHAGYQTIEMRRAGALTVYHMFRTNGGSFLSTAAS